MEEIIAPCSEMLCARSTAHGVNSSLVQDCRTHNSVGHIPWTTFLLAMWVPPAFSGTQTALMLSSVLRPGLRRQAVEISPK